MPHFSFFFLSFYFFWNVYFVVIKVRKGSAVMVFVFHLNIARSLVRTFQINCFSLATGTNKTPHQIVETCRRVFFSLYKCNNSNLSIIVKSKCVELVSLVCVFSALSPPHQMYFLLEPAIYQNLSVSSSRALNKRHLAEWMENNGIFVVGGADSARGRVTLEHDI